MKRLIPLFTAALVLASAPPAVALDIPVGFEVKGGLGVGYFSMGELNDQITIMRQELSTNLSELSNGFNLKIEGRVWLFDRIAFITGYERYWVETSMAAGSNILIYKAPSNVFLMGGAVNVISLPRFIDINLGLCGSFAKSTYGSNEEDLSSRTDDYKSNGYGWNLFAEVNTNFIRPIEVGLQLGYRGLKIDEYENKYQDQAVFYVSNDPVVIDYSGMYFYFTAGIRLW